MAEFNLDKIVELDASSRSIRSELESIRARRNALASEIGNARRAGGDAQALEQEAASLKDRTGSLERDLEVQEKMLRDLMAELPNMPLERVPAGGKESNECIRSWGEKPQWPHAPLDHVQLSKRHHLVDYDRGVKIGGSGFWLYSGDGAALEWALLDYFNRTHHRDGYQFFLPPHLLVHECGFAAGQFPKFLDDVFHLKNSESEQPRFLLPTAETALLNVYRDEIIPIESLPIKAFAYTPCYRRECGGTRADEKGTVRGHQFNKVEMFQFVAPEEGETALQELLGRAERLLQELGLHYRTVLLAAGDTSASMCITYDVEVWLPSLNGYKEVSSVSLAGDFQARRANIRYRPKGEKRTQFLYTLNGSGLATSRLLPAILEQRQQADGSIIVPEPLRPWLGKDRIG